MDVVVDVHADLSESGNGKQAQIGFLERESGSAGRGLPSDVHADLPESGKNLYEGDLKAGKLSGTSGIGTVPDFG
jgi:hypothetical protein